MRSKLFSLVLLLAIAAFAPAAFANTSPARGPAARGTLAFSPSIAFNRTTYQVTENGPTGSATHVNLNLGVGYCFLDQWEADTGMLYQYRGSAGGGRNALGGTLGITYNVPVETGVVPFLSLGIGALSYSKDGSTDRAWLLPMVRLGIRSVMWEGRTINISAGYQHESNPESTVEKSANVFDVGVGMSFFKTY